MRILPLILIPVFIFSSYCNANEKNPTLDELAVQAGTDKSSLHHNYTTVYKQYFSKYKNKFIKFLEIGIDKGDSVKLWENYFPNAELHFIDIDSNQINYHSERSTYHFINQSNADELNAFIVKTGGEFDIIMDDGSHQMTDQITSFVTLFPALNSHGIYIIEDLHTSYWTEYGGGGSRDQPKPSPQSTTEFLKKLIDDVNWVGAKTQCADFGKIPSDLLQNLNSFQKDILSIHFYDSLCLIIKR